MHRCGKVSWRFLNSQITIPICSLTLKPRLEFHIYEIVVGRVIRFADLEYTTSIDREGTSTDHEVEGMLPRDRIIERLISGKTPPSLRHEFWACLYRCQLNKWLLHVGRKGGGPNCNRKKLQ